MSDHIDEHLGRKLRRRRRLLGLTQQQLAVVCGVRFQQIQKYECAANRMSAGRIWQLAKILDVPVGYFFEGLDGSAEAGAPHETDSSRQALAGETRELIRSPPPADAPRRRAFGSPCR